jgi:glutamyl-tRNA synthetase
VTQLAENSDLRAIIRKFALHNAFIHDGSASEKAVLGKLLGEQPEFRTQVKELMPLVKELVLEINSLNPSNIREELSKIAPELLHKEKHEKELVLPELTNISSDQQVVMRFAPGPSGPLHIGHTRAVILNDEYVKRYAGNLIIRLEDTNPKNIDLEAYELIPEDLEWLGVKYHQMVKQSDRFELYYKYAKELLEAGHAYICQCPVESWRKLKEANKPCPDRSLTTSELLLRWEKMLDREYSAGEVSFIVKTDLTHPNPAVRDFVGMRIVTEPHPITEDKFYVYPTYNFSVAVDDHLMGITHILRGKDHLNNTYRQKYIYDFFKWPTPEFLHYGWVSMPHVNLKTSLIKAGIKEGKYTGWSDIQLGTLQAMAQRGIQPQAIRKYWLDVGIKEVDIEFSWANLYSFNKDIVDSVSNRYFFIWEPVRLKVTGKDQIIGHAPLHPDVPQRGIRELNLIAQHDSKTKMNGVGLFVNSTDLQDLAPGAKVRLKDLCNVEITQLDLNGENTAKYIGDDLEILKQGAKIIHWVPVEENIPITVFLPDGSTQSGYCEPATKNDQGQMVQFERYGFVRLGTETKPSMSGWFAHK